MGHAVVSFAVARAASSRAFLSSTRFRFSFGASKLCRPLVRFSTRFDTYRGESSINSRNLTIRKFSSSSSTMSVENSSNSPAPVADGIQLTTLEEKIFDTLKAVLAHFELATQLRVAGGWVRDKLLGKECYDIDIALDNMLGEEFCNKVNEYLATINEQACSVGVIKSNPDQSKHLETARMRLFDMWVDFVNLRSETYAENSRIPTMKFGTPEEDAYRRDLTINSLFYNINTSSVEDFTGKGLSHLRSGIIATPLPPKTTFLDDPLRVLRAIRFAARFNYMIEKELKEAAADNEVKVALANKVSPERIGVEVDLMMTCNNPIRAVQELVEVDIFWIVFRLPEDLKVHVPEETKWECLRTVEYVSKVLDAFGPSKLEPDQRRICYFASLLTPLRSIMYQDRRKKLIPLASVIIKESLKLKSKDAENVVSLHKSAEEFRQIIPLLLDREQCTNDITNDEDLGLPKDSIKAVKAGLVLLEIKELWRVGLVLSTVIELHECLDKEIKDSANTCLIAESMVLELGIENVWNVKPLLDGKTIMLELGLQKGGPVVKEWQEKIRKWQLCHLTGTTEECLQWFREEYRKSQKV